MHDEEVPETNTTKAEAEKKKRESKERIEKEGQPARAACNRTRLSKTLASHTSPDEEKKQKSGAEAKDAREKHENKLRHPLLVDQFPGWASRRRPSTVG